MTKKELRHIVKKEVKYIYTRDFRQLPLWVIVIVCYFVHNNRFYRARLIKSYRLFNYYEKQKRYFSAFFWGRRYGKYANLLNCCINCDNIGEGLFFVHSNIVINKNVVIGKNCVLLGDNCIGAGHYSSILKMNAPRIGDNVWIGYGAKIFGGLIIADDVVIGAGAIITKDIIESGAIVVGNNQIIGNIKDEKHKTRNDIRWW